MKLPYSIIEEFESCNEEFNQKNGKKTIKVAKQNPFAYGVQVCCSFNTTQTKYYDHFGENARGLFVTTIAEVCAEMANEYENKQKDHSYTKEQAREKWNNTTIKSCHICKKAIVDNTFIYIMTW